MGALASLPANAARPPQTVHWAVGYAEKVFEKFGELISKEVLANKMQSEKLEGFDLEKEFEIDETGLTETNVNFLGITPNLTLTYQLR